MTDFPQHHIVRVDHAHARLDAHEQRLVRLETSEKVAAERQKSIEKSLTSIETNISRMVWLIISAIVVALLGLVIQGGVGG